MQTLPLDFVNYTIEMFRIVKTICLLPYGTSVVFLVDEGVTAGDVWSTNGPEVWSEVTK